MGVLVGVSDLPERVLKKLCSTAGRGGAVLEDSEQAGSLLSVDDFLIYNEISAI